MKIVFVCTGNTCRSPMAEGICRALLAERGIEDVICESCGLSAFAGMPATPYAITAAAEYGADLSAHRSRAVTQYLLDEGDLFVCMTSAHAAALSAYVPDEKLRVLADEIPDPFGGTEADYRACAAAIHAGLLKLIEKDVAE